MHGAHRGSERQGVYVISRSDIGPYQLTYVHTCLIPPVSNFNVAWYIQCVHVCFIHALTRSAVPDLFV